MNIEDMNDNEKSVMLAKLCGWNVAPGSKLVITNDDFYIGDPFNLYDPANMALAWRVLNWAMVSRIGNIHHYWTAAVWEDLPTLPPQEAQRLWLDKILSLAIEAGMVEESE